MTFELLLIPAFLSGLVMFISPCTYPILPGYLAFIGGVSADRKHIIKNTAWFLLGFSLVFIAVGALFGALGRELAQYQTIVRTIGGVAISVFALSLLGLFDLPFMKSISVAKPAQSKRGTAWYAFATGLTFSLGWSPCVGPVLGSALLFASTATSVWQGVILLTIFSLGFSIPFFIFSLFVDRLGGFIKRTEKATKVIRIVAGMILLAIGLLFVFNNFELFNSFVLRVFESSNGGYGVFESLY